jgi:hypothetical protein
MNKKIFIAIAIATSILTILMGINFLHLPVQAQTDVQFICRDGFDENTQQRHPTTYAWTSRGKIAVVRWTRDGKLGFEDYPPQKRCAEVSPRFDKAYHQETINMMTNGKLNNQPVICAVKEYGTGCTDDNLLFTLKPEDDSFKAINELKKIFTGEIVGPRHESSDTTPQVYVQIDIEKYLRTAPVE